MQKRKGGKNEPETLEEAGGGDWGSEIRRDEKVWDGGEKEIGD